MNNRVTVLKSGKKNYPWYVSYPDGGIRKKKYFKKKEREGGAEEWAAEMRRKLAEKGSQHAAVSDDELQALIKFREAVSKLPDHARGTTLNDAVESFIKGLESRHKSITCENVAKKLIERLDAEGRGKRHRETIKQRTDKFNKNYGDWLACDVSTEVIDDFLSGLGVASKTQENYRLSLNLLFNHAVKIKAAPSNPVTEAIRPKVKPSETGILKPVELATLLAHANEGTLPGLAISFFAGVRRAELERLDWSEVDLEGGFIEITAANAKTAQRRLIPISDNLKKWLEPHAKHKGGIMKSPAIWRIGLEKARAAAGIEAWPHNAGRHSFASYHLAFSEDPGKLALELGHPDPRLLFRHYRQLVTAKAAKVYWSITPIEAENIINMKTA